MTFFKSMTYPFKGIPYIFKHKGLMRYYLIIPFIIDVIVTISLMVFILFQMENVSEWLTKLFFSFVVEEGEWLAMLTNMIQFDFFYSPIDYLLNHIYFDAIPDGEGFLQMLFKPMKIALQVISSILIIVMFPFLLMIPSALIDPIFRSFLYNKIRRMEGLPVQEYNSKEELAILFRGIRVEVTKIIIYLILTVLFLPLHLIPFLGVTLQFIMTSFFVGWEFQAPYFDEKKMNFRQQFKYVRNHLQLILGFGFPAALMLMVPLVQAFFLSTHTISGSLLSIDIEKGKVKSRSLSSS